MSELEDQKKSPQIQVSMIWWNTSLSPTAKQERSSDEEKETAFRMINLFVENLEIDVICLGEISAADVEAMRAECSLSEYSIHEGFSSAGRSNFDICVLYRTDKLKFIDQKALVSLSGRSYLKVGQRIDFVLIPDETFIHVFVSHWPSRLWCEEHHIDRHLLGIRLRDAIDEIISFNDSAYVIAMGDFNDEPYADSLQGHLRASRDRTLVSKNHHLMYNPFWRHMTSNVIYSGKSSDASSFGGSYYYKSGKLTKWHTFDQIIFSSSFLGSTTWHLREDSVRILDIPTYTDLVKKNGHSFDHMPIFAVIEKEKEGV